MSPGQIVGLLGWIGWVVGIVSGVLQVLSYQRDRKIGPAKELLFEEALRDRKGKYSEAQIIELTQLVRRLERSARSEIPRQARRVFLESQIEATGDTVLSGIKQYERLAKELGDLTEESKSIPSEISQVVESSIVAPAVERHRYQRRLYLVLIVLVIFAVFPNGLGYLRNSLVGVLGDEPRPFGAEDTLDYVAGAIAAICIASLLPATWLRRSIRIHPRMWVGVAGMLLLLAIAAVIYIGIAVSGFNDSVDFTDTASVFSDACIGAAVRIFYVTMRRTKSTIL